MSPEHEIRSVVVGRREIVVAPLRVAAVIMKTKLFLLTSPSIASGVHALRARICHESRFDIQASGLRPQL